MTDDIIVQLQQTPVGAPYRALWKIQKWIDVKEEFTAFLVEFDDRISSFPIDLRNRSMTAKVVVPPIRCLA